MPLWVPAFVSVAFMKDLSEKSGGSGGWWGVAGIRLGFLSKMRLQISRVRLFVLVQSYMFCSTKVLMSVEVIFLSS